MARRLFVDLDGVLADFERSVVNITGKRVGDFQRVGDMWGAIRPPAVPNFYGELDMMPDGQELWEFVRQFEPTILTGLPMGTWAEPQKRAWCASHLGPHVRVICCMARDKAKHAKRGDVLIDDRADKAKDIWEAAGGVFIHHTSAAASIAALRALISNRTLCAGESQ